MPEWFINIPHANTEHHKHANMILVWPKHVTQEPRYTISQKSHLQGERNRYMIRGQVSCQSFRDTMMKRLRTRFKEDILGTPRENNDKTFNTWTQEQPSTQFQPHSTSLTKPNYTKLNSTSNISLSLPLLNTWLQFHTNYLVPLPPQDVSTSNTTSHFSDHASLSCFVGMSVGNIHSALSLRHTACGQKCGWKKVEERAELR